MNLRKIKKVVATPDVLMGHLKVGQPIPSNTLQDVNPFILLHHAGPRYHNPGKDALGVGPHPHRGFEPVTFVFSGEVEHHDSLGNHSDISSGGVQWITAGKGIVHSEYGSKAFQKKGGEFEIIQLWINLPKKLKMFDANYQGFQSADIPHYETDEGLVKINIISGSFNGYSGPVKSLTKVRALTVMAKKGGKAHIDVPESRNVFVYQLGGHAKVNGTKVKGRQLVAFQNIGSEIVIESMADGRYLIVDGDPIKEPVLQYGPFVMNSKSEILEAIQDYESGKMGYLDK